MIKVTPELVLRAVQKAEKAYLEMKEDGQFVGYNQSLLSLLEVDEEQLSKLVFSNFLPDVFHEDKYVSNIWSNITEKLKINGKIYQKINIRDYMGKEKRCVVELFLKDNSVFGFITDITYPTIKKESLMKQIKKIEEVNKSLERFADMISHDLRNSINVANNYLQFIKDEINEFDLSDAVKGYFEKLEQDLLYFHMYMEGLFKIAKAGEIIGSVSQVDIICLIRQSHQFVTNININIDLLIQEDSCWIESDSITLQQVFNNLLSNAYKNRKRDKNCVVNIIVEDIGEKIIISFKDNGAGMDQNMLKEIFNYGFTTRKGLGIGLAICSKIIEAHGGKIWAESEGKNKGTTILFTLPKKSIVS